MTISYLPYESHQEMLLPALLKDWLPKGRRLAHFIVSVQPHRLDGRRPLRS